MNWLRKLLNENVRPDIILIENEIPDAYVEQAEIDYIRLFKCMGADLVNSTDGGDGLRNPSDDTREKMRKSHLGKKLPPEQIEKIRQANIESYKTGKRMSSKGILRPHYAGVNHPSFGKTYTMSEEQKKKIGDANRGKSMTTEAKQKSRNSHLGKILTEEHKQKISDSNKGRAFTLGKYKNKIVQFDTNLNIINIHNGGIAASKATGVQSQLIYTACKGKRKTAGGFIWKYYQE